MRTFVQPPAVVEMVLKAVCAVLGVNQDWQSIKMMLSDYGFVGKLKKIDKRNVPKNRLRVAKELINLEQFDPEIVGK